MKRGLMLIAAVAPVAATAASPPAGAPGPFAAYAALTEGEAEPRFRSWPWPVDDDGGRYGMKQFLAGAAAAERWSVNWLVGATAEHRFDWAEALSSYRVALAAATTPAQRVAAQLAIGRVESITAPADAAATLAKIAEDPAAGAAAAQLRARIAMAMGDFAGARQWLGKALGAAGRHPDRDTPAMLHSIVADFYIAAALAGEVEAAAAYAAASGFGNDDNRGYVPAARVPAQCDPVAGLNPGDAAIFEVAVYSGRPFRVTPVWSRRPGAAQAIAMLGEALRQWRWPADNPPAALQQGLRVYVACGATGVWSGRGGVAAGIDGLQEWLSANGLEPTLGTQQSPEIKADADAADLAAREQQHGVASPQLLAPLGALVDNPSLSPAARAGHRERIVAILAANAAPPLVLAQARLGAVLAAAEAAAEGGPATAAATLPAVIAALPPTDRDSPVGLVARFALAEAQLGTGETSQAIAGLRSLFAVAPARLPAADPMRRGIAYRLATFENGAGHHAVADRLRRDARLPTTLCEYADTTVNPLGISITQDDFPKVLREAGIGGFDVVERSVTTDGRNDQVRVILGIPALLFDAASLAPIAAARSTVPVRAGKPFPCSGLSQPVLWRLQFYGDE